MLRALTVERAVRPALEHHRGGRFAHTALLYRKNLQSVPANPDTRHMVAMPAHQPGKSEIARDLVSLALERKPEDHIMHFNLSMIIARPGRHDDAILCYRKAIALKPSFANAYNDLGIALSRENRLPEPGSPETE